MAAGAGAWNAQWVWTGNAWSRVHWKSRRPGPSECKKSNHLTHLVELRHRYQEVAGLWVQAVAHRWEHGSQSIDSSALAQQ
jgi:hypothetical protein